MTSPARQIKRGAAKCRLRTTDLGEGCGCARALRARTRQAGRDMEGSRQHGPRGPEAEAGGWRPAQANHRERRMSATTDAGPAPDASAQPARIRPYAWVVLFMLMFIYIFNFLDRQLMSILIESIKRDTGFTDSQMGMMTGFYFALFYTV
jgi:hypothetical protein